MSDTMLLTLQGRLESASALPWIAHRAQVLNLAGWALRLSDRRIDIALFGPEPLLGAMEVACSLGPGDVLVEEVTTAPFRFDGPPRGFSIVPEAGGCLNSGQFSRGDRDRTVRD